MTGGKKTGKKGFETEEIVRSYFLGAGFFVLRGVRVQNGGDDLTDIDLWLYERSATLGRRRIIIDVKDNAQPKAAERLFFVKGLAEIIQVEATGVATSDSQRSLRELARRHNVLWIDNADLQRLKSSERLTGNSRITEEMFADLISKVDSSRSSRMVRDAFVAVKSAVADRFGPYSANLATDHAHNFARLAVGAHPTSLAAEVFTRLVYFSIGVAAAALDFTSGETALRPHSERVASLSEVIRFGADAKGTEEKLRWVEAAIRDYAPNSAGLGKAIRSAFTDALRAVPAEGLAEVVAKMSSSDRLFRAARDLELAAYAVDLPMFDELLLDAKSFLGAVLDFINIDRANFAKCWQPNRNVAPQLAEELTPEVEEVKPRLALADGKLPFPETDQGIKPA